MDKVFYISLGGMIGAMARHGLSLLSVTFFGEKFPHGTLLVNLIGCFLIGISFVLGAEKNILSPHGRLFFVTGVLGAFTTFAAYGMETTLLYLNGMTSKAILNMMINNIGGLLMVFFGLWIGRQF